MRHIRRDLSKNMPMPAKMMKMMVLLLLIFLCLLLLLLLPSSGFTIDENLKLFNKPTMKTIMDDGDIYDCVDINKQPAFDHPSLKNHKIQLRPSSYPVGLFDDDDISSSINSTKSTEIGLSDGGCPSGTVPIRRLTKENHMRMKLSLKNILIKNTPPMINETKEELHHQWAQYITTKKLSESYGASAFIDTYSLPLTKDNQFSSSYIWIVNSVGDYQVNIISVGWTISKGDYGDTKTRLTATWTNDNYRETGCRDTTCPGFVQISKELPLGIAIKPLSTYRGIQYGLNIHVFRDPETKNWWFFLRNTRILIGYWPSEIFTLLNTNANKLVFGGVVGYFENTDKPPMGSGHFPVEGINRSCYFSNVKYVDKDNNSQDLNSRDLYPFSSSQECYYAGSYLETGGDLGNMFFFGGPGYC